MDWNNDGALDLITGEQDGHIRIYLRSGSNLGAHSFLRVGSSNWVAPGQFAKPDVVDWDSDGKKDLVVGDGNGRIHLLRNTGTDAAPAFASATTLYTGTGGDRMSPVVCDFDSDGKKDLLFGETYGRVYFCRNTGTNSAPVLAAPVAVTLQGGSQLNVGYYARPTVADWNGDGLQDLIVGADDGHVYYFAQINTNPNQNQAPTGITLSASSIVENRPTNTTVGTLGATDPNTGETFTYTLVSGTGSADNASFTVSGNQLKTAASFNYEARNSYSIRVRVTDAGGLWCESTFTISVSNANESPTSLTLSSTSLAENRPSGTTIGTFSTTDPDAGDSFTYALVTGPGWTDNASFTIVGNELRTAASFDCETQNSFVLCIRSSDAGGFITERAFTISVTDVNEAPTAIALSSASIAENQPAGTAIGTFSSTDPDTAGTFTYTLVSGTGSADNASFTLLGNELKTAASFNYEAKSSYAIRVRSTDQGGLWYEEAFTIAVTDVPAGPLALTTSEAANTISITLSGSRYQVAVDGAISYYERDEVTTISILALGGNDTITIGTGVPGCTVKGGAGNDTISGGAGTDTLFGDDGDDSLLGNGGDDSIAGNWGDDTISGGEGVDQITGGLGSDSVLGGLGDDSLYGGDQSDTIYGDAGHDYIEARGKADTVYGGAGNDTIWGGAGNDSIFGDDGDDWVDIGYYFFSDTVDGGAGLDAVQCAADDLNDLLQTGTVEDMLYRAANS